MGISEDHQEAKLAAMKCSGQLTHTPHATTGSTSSTSYSERCLPTGWPLLNMNQTLIDNGSRIQLEYACFCAPNQDQVDGEPPLPIDWLPNDEELSKPLVVLVVMLVVVMIFLILVLAIFYLRNWSTRQHSHAYYGYRDSSSNGNDGSNGAAGAHQYPSNRYKKGDKEEVGANGKLYEETSFGGHQTPQALNPLSSEGQMGPQPESPLYSPGMIAFEWDRNNHTTSMSPLDYTRQHHNYNAPQTQGGQSQQGIRRQSVRSNHPSVCNLPQINEEEDDEDDVHNSHSSSTNSNSNNMPRNYSVSSSTAAAACLLYPSDDEVFDATINTTPHPQQQPFSTPDPPAQNEIAFHNNGHSLSHTSDA